MDHPRIDSGNDEIARAWIAYYARLGRPRPGQAVGVRDDDEHFWAVDRVMDLERQAPVRALEIVFLIARSTDDDWVLENLGAGPLEGLLARDPTLLDAVAFEVQSSHCLRQALSCVWQNAMSGDTWAAVRRLAEA